MKKVLTVFIALSLLVISSTGVCWALTPDNLPSTVTGVGPGTTGNVGPGVDNQNTTNNNINNTTNTTNNANTEINISGSTISNSNVASNNTVNQSTNVTNTNTVKVEQYVSVLVNGQPLQSDTPSFINGDNRTMVTLRAIAEALGAKVDWDPATQTITITLGDKVVKLVIGDNTYTVNGQEKTTDTAPAVTGGRTVVPARVVGEAFGAKVGWNADTSTVTIDSGNQSNQTNQQGAQTTGQTTQTTQSDWKAKFPICKSQGDNFTNPGTRVVTNPTLWDSGRFDANTTVNLSEAGNIMVEAKIQMKDAGGNVLWTSGKSWNLNATMKLDSWTLNYPTDILPKVADVVIVHRQINQSAAAGSASASREPLTAHDRNDSIHNCSDFHMESDATFYLTSGKLDVKTKTWNTNSLYGFTGAVQAGVWDSSGNLIWTSKVQTYGIDATLNPFGGTRSREEYWSDTAPSDILSKAFKLEIRHGHKSDTENGKHLF